MANLFYNKTFDVLPGNRVGSQRVEDEYQLIQTGFDKLPTPTQLAGGQSNYAVDTGTLNTYVISCSAQITALTDGLRFSIKAATTNTGACTLSVTNAVPTLLGVIPLVRTDGVALLPGTIVAGQVFDVSYSTSMAKFQALLTIAPAGTPTTAAQVTNTPAGSISSTTVQNALNELDADKDASGGYAGLTLFKLNLKNVAGTIVNFFTNASTAARTWTLQDRSGILADDTDLALKANLLSPAFTGTVTGITAEMMGATAIGAAVFRAATTTAARAVLGVPGLQTIGATVAANAMTLTLQPTSLDFRSTALGSGAVTGVDMSPTGPISCVIPQGATLGTVSALTSRLAVIAINNAGAVELAVVNVAGGVGLDESALITTTAIGAGSTSNNVVYSTTARTGVAFRIVGYVESTQATAGTWTTAPSLVQGAGSTAPVRGGAAFSAVRSTNQSITSSTFTKIQCNSEEYDLDNSYDNATNYRFTAKAAGVYGFTGTLSYFASSAATRAFATFYKNGSEYKRGGDSSTPNGAVPVTAFIYLNVGDYVELYGYVVATTPIIDSITYFQGSLIRPA